MANGMFAKALQTALKGGLDLLNVSVKAVFIDEADDTIVLATDEFYSDIAAAARVGTPTALANKTITLNGQFASDDVTIPTVTGDTFEGVLLYIDTGVEATSRLLAYVNVATGLPATPTGGSIKISAPDGFWFRLAA